MLLMCSLFTVVAKWHYTREYLLAGSSALCSPAHLSGVVAPWIRIFMWSPHLCDLLSLEVRPLLWLYASARFCHMYV